MRTFEFYDNVEETEREEVKNNASKELKLWNI